MLSSSTAPSDDVEMDEEDGDTEVPRVESTEDFELCRAIKDKGKSNAASSASALASYETLNPSTPIKGLLSNWETLYVQFRDEDGTRFPLSSNDFLLIDAKVIYYLSKFPNPPC